jgi:hypothetical protein
MSAIKTAYNALEHLLDIFHLTEPNVYDDRHHENKLVTLPRVVSYMMRSYEPNFHLVP